MGLQHGKKPKQLELDLRAKFKDTKYFAGIPDKIAIQNLRNNLTKDKEVHIGMKYLSDITDFIDKHIVTTKEQFVEKGKTVIL